jgi:BlaI family penicillinase repressor
MPNKIDKPDQYLAKRQQQIMEIIYRRGEADVAAVLEDLPDPLSNPAVRAHLRALEEKGHLKHIEDSGKFIYQPTKPRQTAARSALMGLVQNLFHGSVEGVMTTLLSAKAADLTDEDLEHLKTIIDDAKCAKAADHSQDA